MNLITPQTLTPAQESLLTMQQLHAEGLAELANKAKRAFDLLWRNDRATPAEMAAVLGTNAGACFEAHAATVQFILSRDQSLLAPEDYTPPLDYTLHQDGSLTILEP